MKDKNRKAMYAKKKIPLLTSSGGSEKYNSKKILEYRIWVHPVDSSDYVHTYPKHWMAMDKKSELEKKVVTDKEIKEIDNANKNNENEFFNKKLKRRKKNIWYVEEPIGVIKDKKSEHGYREVSLTYPKRMGKL